MKESIDDSHQSPPPYDETEAPAPSYQRHEPLAPLTDVDLSMDFGPIHAALKGFRSDKKALTDTFTQQRYRDPLVGAKLSQLYSTHYGYDLVQKIKDKTHGDLEDILVALIRGPLEHDVQSLQEAFRGFRVDQHLAMQILLCRSNADIKAIAAEYKKRTGKELHRDATADNNEIRLSIYRVALRASRPDESEPVIPHVIDSKSSDLYASGYATRVDDSLRTLGQDYQEGLFACMQILLNLNQAQMYAMEEHFRQKFQMSIETFAARNFFVGDMVFWVQYVLANGVNTPMGEAKAIRSIMMSAPDKQRLLSDKLLRMWWRGGDISDVQAAYLSVYGTTIMNDIKGQRWNGDYERFLLALLQAMS